MKVVIVAKTRMGSGACIGALNFDGCSLRLIAVDRDTNDQFNMEYRVGEVWEVETGEDPEIIPPHVENVIVHSKHLLAPITEIDKFIEQQMPPVSGEIDVIFGGLTQSMKAGARYIAARTGIPERSTMFWRPGRALIREDDQKRIRFRYPWPDEGSTLTFVGFQEPIPEIPAGTFLRVSLAHWWSSKETPEAELRCYVQLSGWFLPEPIAKSITPPISKKEKRTHEVQIPKTKQILQEVFGYPDFRPLQCEIIEKVLRKQNTLGVMPTGSGKFLCFQLPATLFLGLTGVVSPLIALMEDQVLELEEWGIPADYLNSTLTYSQYLAVLKRIKAGETKLVYAAPETLLRPETILLLENCPVDCLVIDEAHCISEWGHDFRPEYRQLAELRSRLPEAVTLAVTATATRRVRQDIKRSLEIPEANEFVSSFNRKNLVLTVFDKINGLKQTQDFLDTHKNQAGIIYCATRNQVDELTQQLEARVYKVIPYYAGMEDQLRRHHQHRFRFEEGIIMVATIAFGMGINKFNMRFILHYDLPQNLKSYYQQIGRAGRNGLRADCLVLYSYGDIATINYFIAKQDPNLQPGSRQLLKALLAYLNTQTCRRKPLLAYFGETFTNETCEACDNCLDNNQVDEIGGETDGTQTDLTIPAQQFLSSAQETGEIFGVEYLIKVLRGSKAKKLLRNKHDQLPSYGIGRSYSEEQWRHLTYQFLKKHLLKRTESHGSLIVTEKGKVVLNGKPFWGELPGMFAKTNPFQEGQTYDLALFEKLRARRTTLARDRGLPPYVIFHDRSLIQMATLYPRTPESLAHIYGVGQRKVAQYGPHILPIIQKYCQENVVQPDQRPLPPNQLPTSISGRRRMVEVWERFQKGETVDSIAEGFCFKPITIINHLKNAFVSGRPLRVDG
jgi:ATP-dependent DNA helicase RecQ